MFFTANSLAFCCRYHNNSICEIELFREGFKNEIHVTGPVASVEMHRPWQSLVKSDYSVEMQRPWQSLVKSDFVFELPSHEIIKNWYIEGEKMKLSWEVVVQRVDSVVTNISFTNFKQNNIKI